MKKLKAVAFPAFSNALATLLGGHIDVMLNPHSRLIPKFAGSKDCGEGFKMHFGMMREGLSDLGSAKNWGAPEIFATREFQPTSHIRSASNRRPRIFMLQSVAHRS